MNNILHIYIEPTERTKDFIRQIAQELDAGHLLPPAQAKLCLPDTDALFSLLTPRRVDLWQALGDAGRLSIRALAQRLGRDYKNVHRDTMALMEAGIIEREADLIFTPWTDIDLHVTSGRQEDKRILEQAA